MNTAQELKAIRTLAQAIRTDDVMSDTHCEANDVLKSGILGLLKRDARRAAKETGNVADIKPWMKQSDWRDYHGYQTNCERTARYVAKWARKYLAPRDGDGNTMEPRVEAVGDRYTVTVQVSKIGD